MAVSLRPSAQKYAIATLLIALALLTACQGSTAHTASTATKTSAPTASPTATSTPAPPHYIPMVLAHGFGSPDDLALDGRNRLLFADFANNGVNRIEPDGHITTLLKGLAEPEGIIPLPNGSLLIAVQGHDGSGIDQVLRFTPGSATSSVFAHWSNATGKAGLDGISRDPRTGDILAADSPNGKIYRVAPDGQRVTLLASGFVRPTDAVADSAGNVYIADEYGSRVARIAPNGTVTTLAHVSLPDDLAFDTDGTLLVTALGNNTLVRLDPTSGRVLGVLATNLHEPQGLVVDASGNIYVSEQTANILLELKRS